MAAVATVQPIDDRRLPESVTIPGKVALLILAKLYRAQSKILDELLHCETKGTDLLDEGFDDLFHVTFQDMFRPCERDDAQNCMCVACNGPEYAAATPLYRLVIDRAREMAA